MKFYVPYRIQTLFAEPSVLLHWLYSPGVAPLKTFNSYQLNETQFCQNQNSVFVQEYIGELVRVRLFYVYGDQKSKNLCTEYYTNENS